MTERAGKLDQVGADPARPAGDVFVVAEVQDAEVDVLLEVVHHGDDLEPAVGWVESRDAGFDVLDRVGAQPQLREAKHELLDLEASRLAHDPTP